MKEKVIECQRRWLDRCKRTRTTELTAMFGVSLGAQKRGVGLWLAFVFLTYHVL